MENMEYVIMLLEKGLEKYGEKPLTNKWLLNILKFADELRDKEEHEVELAGYDDDHRWGSD